jgi:hypothetical protein
MPKRVHSLSNLQTNLKLFNTRQARQYLNTLDTYRVYKDKEADTLLSSDQYKYHNAIYVFLK